MKSIFGKMKGPFRIMFQWPIYVAIFMAIINAGVFFINVKAGFFVLATLVIYGVAVVVFYLTKNSEITNSMVEFASGYAQMQKKLLKGFSVPYGLVDEEGKIIWTNNALEKLIGKENVNRNVVVVFGNVVAPEKMVYGTITEYNTRFADKDYKVILEPVNLEDIDTETSMIVAGTDSGIYALYLFDETEINACKKELRDERFVTALIYIDNYDEALESIDEVRRSLLIALVDRKINKYITAGGGIVKKLEKDKYLVVFRYRFLEQLRDDRFSILEEVKSVNIGNEMSITLSIGVGAMNATYEKNYEMARAAIDLALGRGGDQAVVREGNKVTYYGGKTNSVEKNTRVKARVKAHALRELLESTDNVLIMGHKISDIDAVGAAVGIYAAARVFDKKASIVLNDVTSSLQPFIDLYKNNGDYDKDLFVTSEEAIAKVNPNTLVVVVDVNKKSYTECPELPNKCKSIVVLDHHRQGSEPIDNATLSYIEPYASSACEMVAEILQYICDNIRIKSIEADTIYAGMVIDTNNFTNKTGARTFEAAAFVRRNGADIIRVRKLLRSDATEYKARAEAVRHMEIFKDCYAISFCPSAGLQSPTIVGAQAANELLNVAGVKASFVLTYYNNEIYISARSIDEVNVQLVMERLGGGGHMTIAGAQLREVNPDEAKAILQKTLDTMIQEGAI